MSEDKKKDKVEDETTEDENDEEKTSLEDESSEKDAKSSSDFDSEQAQLEKLLKQIKELEEKKQKEGKRSTRRQRMLAIEFGSIFHHNPILNFFGYFMLNLTIIYSVLTLFSFGEFKSLFAVLGFVFVYTFFEMVFRVFILMRYFKLVIRTLGFIFYFGYLILFYLINVYLFPNDVVIYNEVFLVAFVGIFIVVRYVVSKAIRQYAFIR